MAWWRRFWDGTGWGAVCGFVVILALVAVLVIVYGAGLDDGRKADRLEMERNGGGRYVELTLDGYRYKGWVR